MARASAKSSVPGVMASNIAFIFTIVPISALWTAPACNGTSARDILILQRGVSQFEIFNSGGVVCLRCF
jgi:hypothetical protein